MTSHDPHRGTGPAGVPSGYPGVHAPSTAESRAAEPILVHCTVCSRKEHVEALGKACAGCGTALIFARCNCGFRWAMSTDRAGQHGNCPTCGKVMQYPGVDRSTMRVMLVGLVGAWVLAAATYGVMALLMPPATWAVPVIVGGVLSLVVVTATFMS